MQSWDSEGLWLKAKFFMDTLPKADDVDAKIEHAELDELEYDAHFGRYRLRLSASDLQNKSQVLRELIQLAYERRTA